MNKHSYDTVHLKFKVNRKCYAENKLGNILMKSDLNLQIKILPFIKNFPGLVFARCLQNVFLGAYITADTSLVVYTMGPIKSR